MLSFYFSFLFFSLLFQKFDMHMSELCTGQAADPEFVSQTYYDFLQLDLFRTGVIGKFLVSFCFVSFPPQLHFISDHDLKSKIGSFSSCTLFCFQITTDRTSPWTCFLWGLKLLMQLIRPCCVAYQHLLNEYAKQKTESPWNGQEKSETTALHINLILQHCFRRSLSILNSTGLYGWWSHITV